MSQKNNQQIFLYTENAKKSIIDLQVFNYNVNSFSLFRLVIDTQIVLDSLINISLQFEVFQDALICIKCDVQIMNCTLVFIATGRQISALVIEIYQQIQLQQSFIQYKVISLNSSGLINVVNSQINLSVIDCKLTGGNLIESNNSGFIAVVISQPPNFIDTKNFFICVNNIPSLGNQSISVQFDVKLQCDICGQQYMVYGLCLDSLLNGQLISGIIQCVHPFIFSNTKCVCAQGYIFDNYKCVDILQAIHNMSNLDISGLTQNITNIENIVKELDNSISKNTSQLQDLIQTTQFLLQSYIISNYSSLDAYLQSNTTALENRISGNATLLANSITSNVSELDNYIYLNSTELDLRIYNNISALNFSFTNTTNTISQNLQALEYNLTTLDNFTKNFQQNQSQQNIEIKNVIINLDQQVNCLNNAGKIIDGLCLVNYTVNCSDKSCSQLTFLSCASDQFFVTFSISTQNFSSGYVFTTTIVIQNAFIDVSDSVYSARVNPLFQSQTTFTNLKIQFGVQTFNSGSLITAQSSFLSINYMNIISRSGSQLTVSANTQLNILANSPTAANFNNLLVNLSFASSNGNITLVNNINSVFNISGYQVIGDYNSTLSVAMIGLNVQMATININQVSFRPNIYNVGNCSSYLFGSSVSTVGTFTINNLAIIIGNSSNFPLLGSITTGNKYYLFGGIIAYIDSTSPISVNNVILDSYQKFSTSQVYNSGFLVGYVQSSSSNITIKNMCLQQNMTSTTLQFRYFGLIGVNFGNISIQNASITLYVQGSFFDSLGIIGVQQNSIYAEVVNLKSSVRVSNQGSGSKIGSIFGQESAKNCQIQNVSVVEGNISSNSNCVGGIIAYVSLNVTILNSSVQKTIISSQTSVGGIIGFQTTNSNTTIMNSSISNMNINCSSNAIGGILGFQGSNSSITTVDSSVQNTNISSILPSVGGLIGYQCSNATILNSTVQNTNISGQSQNGGIIGYCYQSKLYLTNVQIKFVHISSSNSYFGVVVGNDFGGTYSFTNSIAVSNYINNVKQAECASLLNRWSVSGC
ncbi:filamentous_hemagglutinin N-terminal domain-containing protein [Hexamita inflata]|uniref:Filamentous hemagglutinin N-terminal domain-containing protein n=1 Tax=Hexamita inflata TaxID=28002 RepID=A0AA86PAX2_9EUKA|nr:filamentous hemagglutinin N-terminal domain-containing protein [Hexamita inflata]